MWNVTDIVPFLSVYIFRWESGQYFTLRYGPCCRNICVKSSVLQTQTQHFPFAAGTSQWHFPLHNEKNPVITILCMAKVWKLASHCTALSHTGVWGKSIINMINHEQESYWGLQEPIFEVTTWFPLIMSTTFGWSLLPMKFTLPQISIFGTTRWQEQVSQHKTVPKPHFLHHHVLSVPCYSFSSLRFTML